MKNPVQTRLGDTGWRFAIAVGAILAAATLTILYAPARALGFAGVSTGRRPPATGPAPDVKRGPLLSLRLIPRQIDLQGARACQRMVVLGTYTDGLERDVTGQSRFSISDPGVAQLDGSNRVSALRDGHTILRVQAAGRVATAPINIRNSKEERPFSFARDIETIFMKRGCDTGA